MTADPEELDPYVPHVSVGPDQTRPYCGFDDDWWRVPNQRRKALTRSLWWTFVPHDKNTVTPKIVTTTLMFTWAIITIGKAFGYADPGGTYSYITILVFAIVCAIWGFEVGSLNNVAVALAREDENDDRE